MSAARGALTGALTLVALQAVVSSNASATRVGGLLSDVASIVQRGLSPSVALIPDLRGSSGSNAPSSSSGSGTAQLPPSQFHPSTVPPARPATPRVPPPVIAPPPTRST